MRASSYAYVPPQSMPSLSFSVAVCMYPAYQMSLGAAKVQAVKTQTSHNRLQTSSQADQYAVDVSAISGAYIELSAVSDRPCNIEIE